MLTLEAGQNAKMSETFDIVETTSFNRNIQLKVSRTLTLW